MVFAQRDYVLKLYDTDLLYFSAGINRFGEIYADILDVNEDVRRAFPLPIALDASSEALIEWMRGRTIPTNRQFVAEILAQAGLTVGDTLGIIDVCKGLSVNDAYWIDRVDGDKDWAEVNLYANELDETLALVAYTGYTASQHKKLGLSSEWTTSGQFPKAWRRLNDGLFLYKGGAEGFANVGMEPYSEYLAGQLANAMGIPAAQYDLDKWKGKLASVCPLLNDADTALVSFYDATGQSQFPVNLAITEQMGNPAFDAMRTMIVFDALIYNEDRHAGNYGFLRNNHTGDIIGMSPLYDHNLALFARDMKRDFAGWASNERGRMPRTGLLSFDQQASMVMGENQHEQLRHLIGFQFKNHPQYPMDEERLDALNNWIGGRVRDLLSMPVANESELRRDLQLALSRVKEKIPALEIGKYPAVSIFPDADERSEGIDLDAEKREERDMSRGMSAEHPLDRGGGAR